MSATIFSQDTHRVARSSVVATRNSSGSLARDFPRTGFDALPTNPDDAQRKSKRLRERIDKLQQLKTELAHMNRLSVMGELTASLAHEITQPTAAARYDACAAIRFLEKMPTDLAEARAALACVVDDLDRAVDIIDGVRNHIKKAPPHRTRFDLGEAIIQAIRLARGVITQNEVSLQIQCMDGTCSVRGDRVQVQQVILNLILNAVEAMSSADITPRELSISVEPPHGDSVLVGIRDSGPGIGHEGLERIFEPFYTTKRNGMGMGLSICRSIIDSHGGRLWAEPNVPRGAAFWFMLPGKNRTRDPLSVPPRSCAVVSTTNTTAA